MWVISRFKRFLHFFSKSEWVNVFLTSVIAAMSVVGTFIIREERTRHESGMQPKNRLVLPTKVPRLREISPILLPR